MTLRRTEDAFDKDSEEYDDSDDCDSDDSDGSEKDSAVLAAQAQIPARPQLNERARSHFK